MRKGLIKILSFVLCLVLGLFFISACDDAKGTVKENDVYFTRSTDGTHYIVTGVNKSAERIVIPDEIKGRPVKKIADEAFFGEKALINVVIPEGITSIGVRAFADCGNLLQVSIPDSIRSIGLDAFQGIPHLNYKYSFSPEEKDSALKYIGNENNPYVYLVGAINSFIKIANVASGCKIIARDALEEQEFLTRVVIPEGVISIGNGAFSECEQLVSVSIPDSITEIGENAFGFCPNLQYNEVDNLRYLGNENNPYVYLKGVISMDTSVESIQLRCKVVGNYAFYKCEGLENIILPTNVVGIGSHAFEGCKTLKHVAISDSVTSIGTQAFLDCSSLESVALPKSLTTLGTNPFVGCKKLKNVSFGGTVEEWRKIERESGLGASILATEVVCLDGSVAI